MASVVGRVRECPIMGIKYVLLGHNTIRGAAGASILNAELFKVEGLAAGLVDPNLEEVSTARIATSGLQLARG